MIVIKILCVGKIKEKYIEEAISDYLKRINKYTNLEIVEIKEEKINDEKVNLQKEGEIILSKLKDNDFIVVLDRNGAQLDSKEFSKKIDNTLMINSNIVFIIGSSYGLGKKILERANYTLSFSRLTFPHQLFRLILLEQIYRAYKIINNETYHK